MVASVPSTIQPKPAAATQAALPHPELTETAHSPRRFRQSVFIWAASLFIVLGSVCAANRFGQNQPANFPFMTWTAWAVQDYLSRTKPPNIAFLGSSLMLVPLSGVDADYLNRRLDGAQHHSSQYFQSEFQKQAGFVIDTFNFALPGEMPSDAFMITDFILKKKKPNVIVYGVGPRDFTDNLLPSPASTDPYRSLSRFDDVSPQSSLMMPDWQQRFSFELGKLFFFYGQREDIVHNAKEVATALIDEMLPLAHGTQPISADTRHLLLPEYMPTELQKGQAFFRPTLPAERKHFTDNLEEYRKRYAKLKKQTFDTQLTFFTKGLESARLAGIHPVIVAMPITDVNRSLLPGSTWNLYRQSVRQAAQTHGATFIDFSEDKDFVLSDFCDTVHLHSGGGQKLLNKIIQVMAADKEVINAVKADPNSRFLSDREGGGYAAN